MSPNLILINILYLFVIIIRIFIFILKILLSFYVYEYFTSVYIYICTMFVPDAFRAEGITSGIEL